MCDCEAPSAFNERRRRARKRHACCECGEAIEAGQEYEYVSGVWDGQGASYKTCLRCAGVRAWVRAVVLPPCDCGPCFGELWEDACERSEFSRPEVAEAAAAAGYL